VTQQAVNPLEDRRLFDGAASATGCAAIWRPGSARFASIVVGQLAASHFLTILEGLDQFRPLGEHVRCKGALDIVFDRDDG